MIEIKNVLYLCKSCEEEGQNGKKDTHCCQNEIRKINGELSHIKSMLTNALDTIKQLINKVDNNKNEEEEKRVKTYADTLKTKNILVVKSNNQEDKAANNKKVIMNKITTPVDRVKQSNEGHLIINFADKDKLNAAKGELEAKKDEINISINEKEKLWPKIKLCNVPSDDDDVREGIMIKNTWLKDHIQNDDEDFKIIRKLKTRNRDTVHYIIKCNPEIRREIWWRDDILYTSYGRNKVFDSYKVYQCYKCQEFNHNANDCNNNQVCAKCGGDHRLTECNSRTEKCVNCEKKGHSDINHKTNGVKCPIYKEEVSRVKNKTDHGFN